MSSKSFYELVKDGALSAQEIFKLKYHKNRNTAPPSKGGQKEFEPDGSWMQSKYLEAFLQERTSALVEPRIEKLASVVVGVWDESKRLVTCAKTSKFWHHMGFTDKDRNWLYPEEALFLMEVNALEVRHHDVPMSIQEAYNIFLGAGVSLAEYQVFAHLRRLGFVVLRHDGKSVVTNYERKINLDKHIDKKTFKARMAMKKSLDPATGGSGGDVDSSNSAVTTDLSAPATDNKGSPRDHDTSPTDISASEARSDAVVEPVTGASNGKESGAETDTDTSDRDRSNQSSSDTTAQTQKRSREDDSPDVCEKGDDGSKKRCLDRNSSEKSSEKNLNKPSSRSFYPESWSDCLSKRSLPDESRSRQPTSWQKNSVQFPNLATQRVMSLVVPDAKLLPGNVSICEDSSDLLVVDCEDYRLKNPIEPVSKQHQKDDESRHRVESLNFSFEEWTRQRPAVVKACSWLDYRRQVEARRRQLVHTSPVSHLWQGQCTPLVHPSDGWNKESILKKLDIIKSFDSKDLKIQKVSEKCPRVSFDVHLPDSSFRKSMPGIPDHRVVVTNASGSPPELWQLLSLSQTLDDSVPVHWAVVDCGEISFFAFADCKVEVLCS